MIVSFVVHRERATEIGYRIRCRLRFLVSRRGGDWFILGLCLGACSQYTGTETQDLEKPDCKAYNLHSNMTTENEQGVAREKIGESSLTRLFETAGPCVVAFISKMTQTPAGVAPIFPHIFGTGFVVDADGLVVTNRHVVQAFDLLPKHPKTGELALGALMFLPGADDKSWQMLNVDVLNWCVLGEFQSSDRWYGNTVPDLGFAQLGVREIPFLQLAAENFFVRVGMAIATIGFPMGTLPLTALGTLNQVTPFLRHGIVSSVYPFPTAQPHGFTIDIMQQGGSSGSPIFRIADGGVIGMMSSGVIEHKMAQSEHASLVYTVNTNISIAEPSGIIRTALDEIHKQMPKPDTSILTLAELRAKHPLGAIPQDLTWDSWRV